MGTSQSDQNGNHGQNLLELQAENARLRALLQEREEELQRLRSEIAVERAQGSKIFELAPDAYLITTLAGQIHLANRAALEMLRVERHELVGGLLEDLVAEGDTHHFLDRLGQFGQQIDRQQWEMQLRSATNVPLEVEVASVRIHDPTSAAPFVFWLLRDITQQKQADRERERLMRSYLQACDAWAILFDNAPVGIARISPNGVVQEANAEMLGIWGVMAEAFINHPIAEFLDGELIERARQLFDRGHRVENAEIRILRRDGTLRHLLISANALRQDGQIDEIVCIARDITEWVQTSQHLQQVSQSSQCLLWAARVYEDPDRVGLTWDLRLVDEASAQQFIPMDVPVGLSYVQAWYQSRPPADSARMGEYALQEIRANRGYQQEFRCVDKHGQIHWLIEDVRVEPLEPDPATQLRRWYASGVCMDITERVRVREANAEFSRQTVSAVTNGKIRLSEPDEIVVVGALVWEMAFDMGVELKTIRDTVKTLAEVMGFSEPRVEDFKLAASEIAANALRHGGGVRSCQIYTAPDRLSVIVRDQGQGVQTQDIPSTILLHGGSTKTSLGMGWSLVQRFVDQAWLATGSRGTTVLLELFVVEPTGLERILANFNDEVNEHTADVIAS